MRMIENKTASCIKFTAKNSSDSNWLSIVDKQGCWSYVSYLNFITYLVIFYYNYKNKI
jgi:hypothetical protein